MGIDTLERLNQAIEMIDELRDVVEDFEISKRTTRFIEDLNNLQIYMQVRANRMEKARLERWKACMIPPAEEAQPS